MTVDIICPLFNAECFIENLHKSILKQQKVKINKIHYILTESQDETENVLKKNKLNYKKIEKKNFSHSLVREKAAFESQADIVVFITQDIEIKNDEWLYELIKDINNDIVACFSRQIAKTDNIEKYTREKNYPATSYDASSAIKRDVFVNLNGYDQKDLPISEDMYIAYKVIMAGYKIKYCAESVVYHSHNFSLKELYNRYKLTGNFFKENVYLNQYGTNQAGGGLAKYVLKRALEDHNFKVLLVYPFNMAARFVGMKVGERK